MLPVGGIKEKVLAAHRAGIKTVLLPEKNKKDLVEVPEEIRKDLTFVFCNRMEDALNENLGAENLQKARADLALKRQREAADKSGEKTSDKPAEA